MNTPINFFIFISLINKSNNKIVKQIIIKCKKECNIASNNNLFKIIKCHVKKSETTLKNIQPYYTLISGSFDIPFEINNKKSRLIYINLENE